MKLTEQAKRDFKIVLRTCVMFTSGHDDDIVCVSENAKDMTQSLADNDIELKNNMMSPPDVCLGARLHCKVMDDVGR